MEEFTEGKNAEEKKEGASEWALRKTDLWGSPEKEKLTNDILGEVRRAATVSDSGRVTEGNLPQCPSPGELGRL